MRGSEIISNPFSKILKVQDRMFQVKMILPESKIKINEYIDYGRLYRGALEKKIKMFYEALSWDLPVDKKNSLERFF